MTPSYKKRFTKSKLAQAISYASLPTLVATVQPVLAQDNQVIEQIVVTASRREAQVQDIPINISAVSGETIEKQRLLGVAEIANYVPGLTVIDRGPRDEVPDILVRGLNTTGLGPGFVSDTVATYLGEIPLQVDLKPVDLDRVEVLIGPQGTLYGQGTMGGAIRYIPNKADPSEFAAKFRGGTGFNAESDSASYEYGLTLNVPLVADVLALRVNLDDVHDPGFIDYNFLVREAGVSNPEPDFSNPADVNANLRQVEDANGEDTISARINLRWLPTDTIDANLWYYYQDTEAEGRQITNRVAFGTGKYESGSRYLEPNNFKNQLISLEVEMDLGFAEATAVYGHTKYEEVGQRDQTDLLLGFEYGYEDFPTFSSFTRETDDQETDTIELRLVSLHDGPLSWVAGYFQNKATQDAVSMEFTPGYDQFLVDIGAGVQLRPDSLEYIQLTDFYEKESAFYGEVSYQLLESLSATIGYRRYEYETDITGGFGLPLADTVFGGAPQDFIDVGLGTNQGDDEGNLFKFNVSWDINDDQLLYFTYSEGYRNGGVNSVPECTPEQIASTDQQLCALPEEILIDPDDIANHEIGLKSYFMDGTLSTNVAVFYIDWEDLQVSTTTVNGSLPITGNGSEAESKGFEFQGNWSLGGNWELAATYAYTNAELTAYAPGLVGPFNALEGSRLPGHAEHQGSFNITYNTDIFNGVDLSINYGFVYTSDVFNIPGGNKDTLTETVPIDPDNPDLGTMDIPADRGGEAIPSYDVHHLSATFEKDNWSVQGFIDNVWNEYYILGTRVNRRNDILQTENGPGFQVGGFTLRSYGQYVGAPRNIGVRLNYKF